jgi:TolB-like protein/DNA-binding winged helix-turn-helix (wHTH) protein/Flp pilus assembly protein TadD
MAGNDTTRQRFRFGGFVLDLERGTLHGPDGELRLRPKSHEVLHHLVLNTGRLVTKDELLEAVWGDVVVTEDSLTQCVVEIRRAIGDHAREVIRTVPRRGYMLDVTVISESVDEHVGATVPPFATPPGHLSAHAPAPPQAPVSASPSQSVAAVAPGEAPFGSRAGDRPRHVTSPRRGPLRMGAAMLAVVAALLAWWVYEGRQPSVPGANSPAWRHATGAPTIAQADAASNAIAVLPFTDMSAAGDQAYLGEGIAEEILNLMAQIDSLKVIARTSSFAFQGRAVDVREIASDLGVTHVLEGSVRRSDDRVRITAQLVDGRDGVHLWSQTYDREVGDIFELQLEIAQQVSDVLAAALHVEPRARHRDIGAYEHLLRGRFLFQRRAPGDMERAREHFEAAVALDPEDGAAWAALSGCLTVEIGEGRLDVTAALPRALEAAQRAVALSPGLPEAHLRAARAYSFAGDDERAWRHIRIAEALNPDDPLLLGFQAGMALLRDDLAGALALQERVMARDPLSVVVRNNYARMLQAAGRLAEARAQWLAILEISPGRPEIQVALAVLLALEERHEEAVAALPETPSGEGADVVLAVSLHALGRAEEAQAAVSRLETGTTVHAAHGLAEIYAQRDDADAAWRWLGETRRRMQATMPDAEIRWRQQLRSSGFLRPLEDDPRWHAAFRDPIGPG